MIDYKKLLLDNYDFSSIEQITPTINGSGKAYIIKADGMKYIMKTNEREDFINIYQKVEQYLNQNNFLQSNIIKTNNQSLMTKEGIVLYEFITGDNHKVLNQNQINNAINYIRKYNDILKQVSFKKEDLKPKNHWDYAGDINYIVNDFYNLLDKFNLSKRQYETLLNAITILKVNQYKLKNTKQLIHSDLGPDNFMFNCDEVKSIIDFTPQYHHEDYSLCQFFYWNFLWQDNEIDIHLVRNILNRYYEKEINIEQIEHFNLLLIQAALFRIIGPMIELYNNNQMSYKHLEKRFIILETIINYVNKE